MFSAIAPLLLLLLAAIYPRAHAQLDPDRERTCSNDFSLLEQSLLGSADNRLALSRGFFPPKTAHPIIVSLRYNYTPSGELTDMWFWSESEFYLLQPLEILQYTSLFFSNLPFRQTSFTLVLEEDCANASSDYMNLLTQRLKLYAQSATTSPGSVGQRIGDTYIAVAAYIDDVRADRLQSDFVKAWLHLFLILFPLGTVLMVYLCDPVQLLLGDKTWQKLDDEHSHATIAALIQIGVCFTAFVFVVDWFAFGTTIADDFLTKRNAAFYLTTITGLVVDFLSFGWVVYVIGHSFHFNFKHFWHQRKSSKNKNLKVGSEKIKKLMTTTLIPPILCIANHIHYIAIAFLSDPFHAGTVGVGYGLSVAFHYFIFRQFYNRVVLHTNTRKKKNASKTVFELATADTNSLRKDEGTDSSAHLTEVSGPVCRLVRIKRTPFNTQMVVVGLFCIGPLILLYEGLVIVLFSTLPFSKTLEDAPNQLSAVTQGAGILIVLLLTYNIILNPNPFSLPKAVGRIGAQLHLSEKVPSWAKLTDEEKFAHITTVLFGKSKELKEGYAADLGYTQEAEDGLEEMRMTDRETTAKHNETPV